jgi:hypothetical protein
MRVIKCIRSAILIVSAEKARARDIIWAMIDVQLSSLYVLFLMDYFINIAGHRFG